MERSLWRGLFLLGITEVTHGDVEGSRAHRTVAMALLPGWGWGGEVALLQDFHGLSDTPTPVSTAAIPEEAASASILVPADACTPPIVRSQVWGAETTLGCRRPSAPRCPCAAQTTSSADDFQLRSWFFPAKTLDFSSAAFWAFLPRLTTYLSPAIRPPWLPLPPQQ